MVDDEMQKEELEYEILPCSELLEKFTLVHLKGQVGINVENNVDVLQEEMLEIINKATMGAFGFYLKAAEVFLSSEEEICGIDGTKAAENLIVREEDGKKKKGRSTSEMVLT